MFDRINGTNTERHGGGGRNAYDPNQNKKEDQSNEFESTVDSVQRAIEDFSSNEQNVSHGISASQEGNGPGLKVILKGYGGEVLRSITGEEFLKLREAAKTGSKSGRILDRKV